MSEESTERFSNRVADYTRYRPDYPAPVLDFIVEVAGWKEDDVIADIGSGSGIFTRHLLEAKFQTYAVEPNGPMREAAEAAFEMHAHFHSIPGTASDTPLADGSVDGIVCAQSFHWFHDEPAKKEFARILKPDGYVALVWNNRLTDADAFAQDYERLLQEKSSDYASVNHQNLKPDDFAAFFRKGDYRFASFPNEQVFHEAEFIGRAFSSSYVPPADSDAGKSFAVNLHELFQKHQQNGTVRFRYATEVFVGQIARD